MQESKGPMVERKPRIGFISQLRGCHSCGRRRRSIFHLLDVQEVESFILFILLHSGHAPRGGRGEPTRKRGQKGSFSLLLAASMPLRSLFLHSQKYVSQKYV